MQEQDANVGRKDPGVPEDRSISRREFLKIAGVVGAAVGLGAGLSEALAACAGEGSTTTSGGSSTTTAYSTTTSLSAPTTTVTTEPETGRYIVLGLVSPSTGSLALFGRADDWWEEYGLAALPNGIIGGDGKRHRILIARADSQSSSDRAARVAGELIKDRRVDLMMASGDSDTVNSVADQCEAFRCPSITNFVPWRSFFYGRGAMPDKPFKWTYAQAVGLENIVVNYIAMWDQVNTNKKVGFLFANDTDGLSWANAIAALHSEMEKAGYAYIPPDLYTLASGDFSRHIAGFKKEGCEICCGASTTQDFISFWKQAIGDGYNPKVLTIGKALLFPQALEAVGNSVYNTTVEALWHPTWPFRDSVTGKTCQELAEDYMAKRGEEWVATIGQYAKFEWAVDVFKRVTDPGDREDVIARVRTTKLDTCLGPIDFTAEIDAATRHPVENVYLAPVGGAQWVKSERFAFEQVMVGNTSSPELPIAARVQPMQYQS